MKHHSVSREANRKPCAAGSKKVIKQLVEERIQVSMIRRCNKREVYFVASDNSLEVQRHSYGLNAVIEREQRTQLGFQVPLQSL